MEEIKYFIGYILNYKENVKELQILTQRYDDERSDNVKANNEIIKLKEQNNFLNERNEKHLETIKEKNKQIRQLKKQNKFLMERENKLQRIEQMFKNKRVILKDLKALIEEDK